MAGNLYTLLVGVDRAGPNVPALGGCANDVASLSWVLHERVEPERVFERRLIDLDATRDAVIAGFEDHLSHADQGDVVLFHFSGCGSGEPVPPDLERTEPTGKLRTLVCADSRAVGGTDLAELELMELALRVADRGAHVLLIVDAGFTSSAPVSTVATIRAAPERDAPRASDRFLSGMVDTLTRDLDNWSATAAQKLVTLCSAFRFEAAYETAVGKQRRGVLSFALQDILRTLDHDESYATVASQLGLRLPDVAPGQTAELFPADAAGPVLGGLLTPRPAALTAMWSGRAWVVNAGPAHGLGGRGGPKWTFALLDVGSAGGALATTTAPLDALRTELAVNEPDRLDRAATCRAVVASPPALTIEVQPPVEGMVADDETYERLPLEIVTTSDSYGTRVGIVRIDGSTVTATVTPSPSSQIQHIQRWWRIKRLANPWSELRRAVRLDVFAAAGSGNRTPDGPALAPDGTGFIDLAYGVGPAGSVEAPLVRVMVTNVSDRALHVAVLDVTDSYAVHVVETTSLSAGDSLALWNGQPIPIMIPDHRLAAGGTSVVDFLMAIACETEFDAHAFEVGAIDAPPSRSVYGGRSQSLLEDLVTPDASGERATAASDWATVSVGIRTHLAD